MSRISVLLLSFVLSFFLAKADTLTRIQNACGETSHPELCISSLTAYKSQINENPSSICQAGMKAAAPKIQTTLSLIQNSLIADHSGSMNLKAVLEDCHEIIGQSLDSLDSSISKMQFFSDSSLKDGTSEDIWTWMSASLTDHSTCIESLQALGSSCPQQLLQTAESLEKELSNALDLFVSMKHQSSHGRKLLAIGHQDPLLEPFPYQLSSDDLPAWMPPPQRRRLLHTTSANIVVAPDGSGNFKSVQAAVNAASPGNVIYVKSGTYSERVLVPKSKTNLVLVGDGIGKTIITASTSKAEAGTTLRSPTVAIKGAGFVGKYLTIQNTAGPNAEQAVALLVTADRVAFYQAAFHGYQDTLYTYTNRQFYRQCDIHGTVDFIFGNAAAVLQSCSIYSLGGRAWNTVTAQGRKFSNQNTGLSFQGCSVGGASNTYLGRPWHDYARTVFMQCQLSGAINSAGWLEWGGASYRNKLVYYGEYGNTGAGASTSGRVSWSRVLSASEASQFTVGSFIGGGSWLSVPYS